MTSQTHVMKQLNSKGFSLLEVMAALVMVAIALTAMSPAIVMGAASRVHSRRIEAATNLAYQEVDRVRNLIDQGPDYNGAQLPNVGALNATPPAGTIAADLTGEFFVQSIRDAGTNCPAPNAANPCNFSMVVRVYSNQAFNGGAYSGSADITAIPANISGPNGVLRAAQQPLVSISAELGNLSTLNQYCTNLGGGC